MKLLLSLVGLVIVASTLLTGPLPTLHLVSACLLLALCLLGILVFWGKENPLPAIDQLVYVAGRPVTVVRTWESFLSVPEWAKAHSVPLEKDAHVKLPFVLAIDSRGQAILSPYFSPIQTTTHDDHSKQDRGAAPGNFPTQRRSKSSRHKGKDQRPVQ